MSQAGGDILAVRCDVSKAAKKAGPTGGTRGKGPMLERWADPGEVAELALYLASDSSAFVTAANFVIDGGLSAI